MKIQFESNLNHQNKAISSIVDIFEGQEICKSNFSVSRVRDDALGVTENELGIGNKLELLDDEILANVQKIQLRNGLAESKKLESMDFSVEMETGTGKTYVYLKSIFELNQKYGFTKFIIAVPSIAIKEGTKKTLDITTEHFKSIFDNVNYDYFIYDSSNKAYIKLISVKAKPRSAKVEIDVNQNGSTKRKALNIKDGSDLYELSNGLDVYEGYTVNNIYTKNSKILRGKNI